MKLIARAPVSEFRERIRWMALLVLVGTMGLGSRFFYLQVVQAGRYAQLAEENILRRVYLPSTRGVIRDSRGRVIASNRPAYNVYVVPYYFLRRYSDSFPHFSEWLGLNRDERDRLEARLRQAEGPRRFQQILVREDIDRETLALLETHRDELPGVSVIAVPLRTYPFRELASHAIGFLNEVSLEDITNRAGEDYRAGDQIGRMGIERAWESVLRGRRGWVRVDRDHRGVVLSSRDDIARFGADRRQEPVSGRDLVLTLDMELMRAIDRSFRQHSHQAGAAAVVDIRSGRVLALYSRPAVDPNLVIAGLSLSAAREIEENPLRPRIDRAIYETYFPGSTMKPFTALAALGLGVVNPNERNLCTGGFETRGRTFHCPHHERHGPVNLYEAIVRSCNVYFFNLVALHRPTPRDRFALQMRTPLDAIADVASNYGFGRRSGIGINDESAGFIPTRAWYLQRYRGIFRPGFTLNAAIGQGNTRVTVLQLALAYAALANGGTLYVPRLVERVEGPDGSVIESFPSAVRRRVASSPAHVEMMLRGLRGVVTDPLGTAHRFANIPEVEIAGKTGTAEIGRGAARDDDDRRAVYLRRDHAWFAAVAPASSPEIAIVVLVEHGGVGGAEAAPVVADVLRDYFTRIRPGEPIPTVARVRREQEQTSQRLRERNRGQ